MRRIRNVLTILGLFFWATSCGGGGGQGATADEIKKEEQKSSGQLALTTFKDESEFKAHLKSVLKSDQGDSTEDDGDDIVDSAPESPLGAPESGSNEDTLTNNQEAGADEGGLVKNYKDYLVILRRGKLITVKANSEGLKKIDEKQLPFNNLSNTVWYDELNIMGNRLVVIGYRWGLSNSYYYGATEVNLVEISEEGKLSTLQTYLLESGDYYSYQNYSSRIVGDKLILYAPYYAWSFSDTGDSLHYPMLKRVDGNGSLSDVKPLFVSTDIFKPANNVDEAYQFHMFLFCTLPTSLGDLNCTSRVVNSYASAIHYVSANKAYLSILDFSVEESVDSGDFYCPVTTTIPVGGGPGITTLDPSEVYDSPEEEAYCENPSSFYTYTNYVYAFDTNGQSSGVAQVEGLPLDQFSFSENPTGLSVALTMEGTTVCASLKSSRMGIQNQIVGMAHIPHEAFKAQIEKLDAGHYTCLESKGYVTANRFTSNHLAFAVHQDVHFINRTSREITSLSLPFEASRLEPAGDALLAMGSDWRHYYGDDVNTSRIDLGLQRIMLDAKPTLGNEIVLPSASIAEHRSHAFSYGSINGINLFGLPVTESSPWDYGWSYESWHTQADNRLSFFTVETDGEIRHLGDMRPLNTQTPDDACEVSCIDWYGSMRPVFVNNLILGLMSDDFSLGRINTGGTLELNQTLDLQSGKVF